MYIIQVASELAPVAKVGGLADVVYGLSKELRRQGHEVEIILPKYDCLDYSHLKNLRVEHRELWSFDGPLRYNNTIWTAELDGLKVLLIEAHHPDYFFSRGVIYGCHDDINRFTYFSRAAMEYLYKSGKHPDVIHVHDWPTALVPVLYRDMYVALGYRAGGTMLTIHNVSHQGKCQPFHMTKVGLNAEKYLTEERMLDPVLAGHVNILKGGIEYADQVTTVSPTYLKEILAEGFGLEETLNKNRKKLKGILNGIDEDFWNPKSDSFLVKNYDLNSVVEGKKENKRQLRVHLGLEQIDTPMVACVTRLVPQKAPELIKVALFKTVEREGQFVLLGSTPIIEIHRSFERLQKEYKNNGNVAISMDKDESLAHLIYAAADMFVIPSIFEPCGLTQMISLKYGTVPIVRKTGGLADTIFDLDNSEKPMEQRNGFTFEHADTIGLNWALDRAIDCYRKEPDKWLKLMKNGMKMDFSWKKATQQYLTLYKKIKEPKKVVEKERLVG